jgi:hypothetical protein
MKLCAGGALAPRDVGIARSIELSAAAPEMRRHVAGGARIGVVAPRAADAARLLERREGPDAGALQLNGEADTRKPGADDGDV